MSAARRARGLPARPPGRRAQAPAALWLTAKGCRILGLRLASSLGEIDLLAHRGGAAAVVEVKRSTTLEAALEAVSGERRAKLRRGRSQIAVSRVRLRDDAAMGRDLIALAPGRLPRQVRDAWREGS